MIQVLHKMKSFLQEAIELVLPLLSNLFRLKLVCSLPDVHTLDQQRHRQQTKQAYLGLCCLVGKEHLQWP